MEELIKALNVIKETCDSQAKCEKCPLSKDDDCMITYNEPSSWDIQQKPILKVLL